MLRGEEDFPRHDVGPKKLRHLRLADVWKQTDVYGEKLGNIVKDTEIIIPDLQDDVFNVVPDLANLMDRLPSLNSVDSL